MTGTFQSDTGGTSIPMLSGGAIIITLLYPLEYSKSYRKHNSFSVYSIVAKHKVPAADNKKKISEKVELL